MASREREADGTICPTRENPLSWPLRLSWRFLNQRLYPADRLYNPILYYLTGRRHWTGLLGDLLGMSLWFLLIGIEAFTFYVCDTTFELDWWLLLLVVHILVGPLIVGAWTQLQIHVHYYRQSHRLPMEELKTTRLTPREIMFGFLIRPLARQACGLFLYSGSSIVMWGIAIWLATENSLKFSAFDLALLGILIWYRHMVFLIVVQFSAALGIRSTLFIKGPFAPLVRAIRDWAWPYAMIPWAMLIGIGVLILAFLAAEGLGCIALFVFIPFSIWLMVAVPGALRDHAGEILYWLPRQIDNWSLISGERHTAVPERIWSHWPAYKRPPKNKKIRRL